MRNKLLTSVMIGLFLSGCGTGYNQDAFVDKAQEKVALSQEFGTAIERKDKKIVVVAPKQYVLDVLRKMSEKNKHVYEVIWDRKSASVEYTADKLYKISVYRGNTTEVNDVLLNTFETYSLIEFESPDLVSPQFKQLLLDAFKAEQKKHDPHEHVNGLYTATLKSEDVKIKLDQFFRKLYPSATFSTQKVHGKASITPANKI